MRNIYIIFFLIISWSSSGSSLFVGEPIILNDSISKTYVLEKEVSAACTALRFPCGPEFYQAKLYKIFSYKNNVNYGDVDVKFVDRVPDEIAFKFNYLLKEAMNIYGSILNCVECKAFEDRYLESIHKEILFVDLQVNLKGGGRRLMVYIKGSGAEDFSILNINFEDEKVLNVNLSEVY